MAAKLEEMEEEEYFIPSFGIFNESRHRQTNAWAPYAADQLRFFI